MGPADADFTDAPGRGPVTVFGPDFPFDYAAWLEHPAGLGALPAAAHGKEVAVIGGGIAGLVAAYELMRLGLRPVVYEAERLGGRLRSERFPMPSAHQDAGGTASSEVVAELGGMRFPISSTSFFHYLKLLGLRTAPFPNPLTEAAGSTVIDLGGQTWYAESLSDLPALFAEVAQAWDAALQREFDLGGLQEAIRNRDAQTLKQLWNKIVAGWDDTSFYEFVSRAEEFAELSFRHREVFGQVGFGTGGWDSDFANSMLEILRVVVTECDTDQELVIGGVEQLPVGLWHRGADDCAHWPPGTSLASLHASTVDAAPSPQPGSTPHSRAGARGAVASVCRDAEGRIAVTETTGEVRSYDAVLATCQSWLLTTEIDCDENLFSQGMWMALDRTRYMQSSKTFVVVDRPFWKQIDPKTGRQLMSMTLTDRLTRGTYLFDNGPEQPGVICLTYSWMSDALKMLPYSAEKRAELAIRALEKIYPDLDLRAHILGEPVTVSWESNPYFLGAFKGALPGHYRYNHRMYGHFMQDDMPEAERGIFLAGDSISFTPAWAEGAVQTALNAVWGILRHFGGGTHPDNPGPGDQYPEWGPVELPE
ncbi:NAD(P)/FAD-dependent oxidoreductase [Nesterenkonia sphaerica]|uniref:NAD(P)/FAD-dependent oxidoreductase n=2 Tax=Nesterenkonia sphaerica TaxID=1804988 RepID=A0A5R9AL46_9MICC|nr:NAD(P)/FAD-dependent oxidoreductase [Nesterenkonia sphaerica]